MIICDLCGHAKDCLQKEIETKEYDICSECWSELSDRLKGKGRASKQRDTVFLPHTDKEPEPRETRPVPGEPPKIWSTIDGSH
jgi:hypothetical protein